MKSWKNISAAFAVAVVIFALAQCADAQTANETFVVTNNPGNFSSFTPYDDLGDAVEDAISDSDDTDLRYLVLVDLGTWPANLRIREDANIAIIAAERTQPFNTVVIADDSEEPVISVVPLALPFGVPQSNRLVIDGLTIQGGRNGIELGGAAASVISRCYIRKNVKDTTATVPTGNGILCLDSSTPKIINCSIVENETAGIYCHDSSRPGVLFCSIIENGDYGVYANSSADVRNTLVYQNGGEPGEGGLIWNNIADISIKPSSGDVDSMTGVTITGLGLLGPGGIVPDVYFGPPSVPGTIMTGASGSQTTDGSGQVILQTVTGQAPPSWLDAPGPVDVFIERSDGFMFMLRDGFTYVQNNASLIPPYVTQVIPEHGPPSGGNWVTVYGMRFDQDCDVEFDFNSFSMRSAPELSPLVRWLSSGELRVEVPELPSPTYTAPLMIDVLVTNPTSGLRSPAGQFREYEYRNDDATPGCTQPIVLEIVPEFYRDLEGDSGQIGTVNIHGREFQTDCVVQIGDIICEYDRINTYDETGPAGVPDGVRDRDTAGRLITTILEVKIPVAQFGAGGSYDVQVTNICGLYDVLPNAFTYFPNSRPQAEPSPDRTVFRWRPANFIEFNDVFDLLLSGNFTLLGDGFDTELNIFFDIQGIPNSIFNAAPSEVDKQHQRHSQREIGFLFPPTPYQTGALDDEFFDLSPNPPPVATTMTVDISNAADTDGDMSATEFSSGDATEFSWADPGFAFEITQVSKSATAGSADMTVTNWNDEMAIWVHDIQVSAADIDSTNAPTIEFIIPAMDTGVFGPVDVAVVLPGSANALGEELYYVKDNALWIPREQPAGTPARPFGRAVKPKTVPETGALVTIEGSDFLGPYDPSGAGTWIFTKVFVRSSSGWFPIPENAIQYTVESFNEISFFIDLQDKDPLNSVQRDVPVDILLQHWDPVTGLPVPGPIQYVMHDAIVFTKTLATPVITGIHVPGSPLNLEKEWGPVEGGTPLVIVGTNFTPSAIDPWVRIGGAEAKLLNASDNSITVVTPPAPQGLPGTHDVVVITRQTVSGTTYQLQARAPRDEWFTYIMDGAPSIDYISPNHAPATFIGKRYATIHGRNFDDKVVVTMFEDISGDGLWDPDGDEDDEERGFSSPHFSISPFEIVIELKEPGSFGFDTSATSGDFPAGLLKLQVNVQNTDTGTNATVESLTSNTADFTFYNDQYPLSDIEPDEPKLEFNDVYNNYIDYWNVSPGKGSISLDPLLDPGFAPAGDIFAGSAAMRFEPTPTPVADWWLGKLQKGSPLVNKAGTFGGFSPYSAVDFELDERPLPGDTDEIQDTGAGGVPHSDIGADEVFITGFGAAFSWYFCLVNPAPVGKGSFEVWIGVNGLAPGGFSAFWVPQGGNVLQLQDRIPINLSFDSSSGLRRGTSSVAGTVLYDRPADDGLPSFGDLIADGHAAVYLLLPDGDIIGDSYNDLTDDGRITDDAILGRHFLIDTIPPEIAMDVYPAGGAFATDFLELAGEGAFGHLNHGAHPGYLRFPDWVVPDTMPQVFYSDAASIPGGMFDSGRIRPWPFVGDRGAQAFYNVGSFSNRADILGSSYAMPPSEMEPLNVRVSVRFVDPPVRDVNGLAVGGRDAFTRLSSRQVAGFDESIVDLSSLDVDEILIDSEGKLPARWIFDQKNLLAGTDVYPTYGLTGPNPGFFPAYLTRSRLLASWTFADDSSGLPGIPWLNSSVNAPFHLSIQFAGKDLSGNITNASRLLDPLHIWWILETETLISPNRAGMEVGPNASFGWDLNRSFETFAAGQPSPLFTFKLWQSDLEDGPYTALPPGNWTPWDANTVGLNLSRLLGFEGKWILLVVRSCDEAGNVEPWPLDIVDFGGGNLFVTTASGTNFQKFKFVGQDVQDDLDTSISPIFWYDRAPYVPTYFPAGAQPDVNVDSRLVYTTIIPYPETDPNRIDPFFRLLGQFRITMQTPPGAIQTGFKWQLEKDGITVIDWTDVGDASNGLVEVRWLSDGFYDYVIFPNRPVPLGEFSRQRDGHYVLRAATFVIDSLEERIEDTSPANLRFTVVPGTVASYIESKELEDKQPIKERETEVD